MGSWKGDRSGKSGQPVQRSQVSGIWRMTTDQAAKLPDVGWYAADVSTGPYVWVVYHRAVAIGIRATAAEAKRLYHHPPRARPSHQDALDQ